MKKRIYAILLVVSTMLVLCLQTNAQGVSRVIRGKRISGMAELNAQPEVRFNCPVAKRNGNTFTNTWSNYYITCNNSRSGYDYFDTTDQDSKYDFALVFNDDSRLAIYYTTLSRDLNTIAFNFATTTGDGKGSIEDKVFAGQVFKHIAVMEPNPYGMNVHEFYIRQVDADKLMVVDMFYTNPTDQACQALLTMSPLAVQ